MLLAEELSKAMSFTDEKHTYNFKKSTSTANRVKMVGNAVAVKTAYALIRHAMQYRFAHETQAIAA
jgi:site-specific DNA-cytosine methylase